jgi:hypothetical protein
MLLWLNSIGKILQNAYKVEKIVDVEHAITHEFLFFVCAELWTLICVLWK